MSVANIRRLQEPFRRRKMVSARFRRHPRGLRNYFATPSYLPRAAKLASTLKVPSSLLAAWFVHRQKEKHLNCTKMLRNHFATKGCLGIEFQSQKSGEKSEELVVERSLKLDALNLDWLGVINGSPLHGHFRKQYL
uniref:Uncharacterized protein n=1 Tax=Vitis vinifera TaxID=29760 RepID=A5AVR7_VITVI|nr:hypothetical protein VITISV_013456 [Vitis vinifera]